MEKIYRKEFPNPQFERKNWQNLNGEWEFEIDKSNSGEERKIYENALSGKIIVPFCPESKLSGVHNVDFMNSVWYRKEIEVSAESLKNNIFIHFGAVDYKATLFVNNKKVGTHFGGYTSFYFNITKYLTAGKNKICLHAEDDNRSGNQPAGKQSDRYHSYDCDYTRTTGIWQTVWIEFVPKRHIKSVKYFPNYKESTLTIEAECEGCETLEAKAAFDGKTVGEASAEYTGSSVVLTMKLSETHLWELGRGGLYDLELTYGEDKVYSYFGLRNVWMDGMKFMLNGKSVFQRLVLDQGFYPDGIYTAKCEEDLINDIKISMGLGFNGARLHQKVFEPRFLYHCDRLGYMVWGEHGNWGLNHTKVDALHQFLPEWIEAVERDFNHPSIIGWCPFNETWDLRGNRQCDAVIEDVYKATKALDKTRPCIDTSGHFHVITDIYDVHDYEQDPTVFKKTYDDFAKYKTLEYSLEKNPATKGRQPYNDEAFFVSEYGGMRWDAENTGTGWGYGNEPKTEQEFIERYKGLTDTLLDNEKMFGFCYTQLYDVEQEINGLYTYHRKPKFAPEIFRKINERKAKIED
ncbi:MAG: glycoside hydrolase family 2 TIM barrel-domain containing protein [Firmicutes bacterium]|nr:glycoside hydrolase family 2 TIM barrel-domain containing protein [Bacillota bacterium]